MKPQAAGLRLIALIGLWVDVVRGLPVKVTQEPRTKLPWLLLLSYPLAAPPLVPGIPIRRPQDEPTVTRKPSGGLIQVDEMPGVAADAAPTSAPASTGDADAQIREQFLLGLLQGLQSTSGDGPTVPPAVLADLLQQVTTEKPTKTKTANKEAPLASIGNDNDPDYDYIDFKNGSRIKYELDSDQQLNDSQSANKTPVQQRRQQQQQQQWQQLWTSPEALAQHLQPMSIAAGSYF